MPGGFCGKKKGYTANDEFFTPPDAWNRIRHRLPTDRVVWEAFRGDGTSAEHLRSLGLRVECEDEDFFQSNRGEVVVSNPPFSKKKEVLQRLLLLNKPFILLMPYEVLFYKYLAPFRDDLQLLVPTTRIQFLHNGQRVKFNYDCVFFCWRMNLPHDLEFV